jgi:hypothetical protein
MNTPSFVPQLGMSLTAGTAEHANWRLLATPGEYLVYGKKTTERGDTHYIVCAGPLREITTITASLQVATFASTLEQRRQP